MKIDDLKKVCMVGSGLMGRQIALNTAVNGYKVALTDNSAPNLDKAKEWVETYLAERLAKGKMTQETINGAKANLEYVYKLEDAVKDADLIIEAIIEDEAIKKEFFKTLDKLAKPNAVIATNSSRMVSSLFADCVTDSSRLANLHYFNPVMVMQLVEVVQGAHTSKDTVDFLMEFCRRTGKDPIWLRKEIDGFVVNRILGALNAEASYLLEMGIATPEEIDKGCTKGLNHPMGPFRLRDFTGLDTSYNIQKRQYELTGVKPYAFDQLEALVKAGHLGVKTGKGWYDYSKK